MACYPTKYRESAFINVQAYPLPPPYCAEQGPTIHPGGRGTRVDKWDCHVAAVVLDYRVPKALDPDPRWS